MKKSIAARLSLQAREHCRLGIILLMGCSFAMCGNIHAETVTGNPPETPEATRVSQPPSPSAEAAETEQANEEPAATTLSVGGDLYYGRSNLDGYKTLRDGFWAAGTGLAYPSVLQMRLATRNGAEAKLAFGVGDIYTDNTSTLRQPHEAWYSTPTGNLKVTAGKYYVPFALQEWQYETKWGAMVEGTRGATDLAASLNYNNVTNSPNAYLRIGRNFGENANVGLSLGAGKGLSYNTVHNRAIGLDASANWKGWKVLAEYVALQRRSSERFNFGWVKLEYDRFGKVKPYVAHWRWRDKSDNFGRLRSTAVGASYSLRPDLAIEGGYSFTSDGNVKWIQLHWTPEWTVWSKTGEGTQNVAQNATMPGIPQQMMSRRTQ